MENSPVLAITSLGDVTADLVLGELHGRGVSVVRLDPGIEFPDAARMGARIDEHGLAGHLDTATRHVNLSAVRSVYWRRPTPHGGPVPAETPEQQFTIEQSRSGYTGVLTALPGALYVNHPIHNRAADYNPGQLATAARLGLCVPATLVTNSAQEARQFVTEYGSTIYKPVHGVHLADADGRNRTVWVRPVEADGLDDSITLCPHLFQACVPKVADIRLAAVGEALFATRIDTDGDYLDWREDQTKITFTPMGVPAPIRSAVHAYFDAYGLTFGAFDFALDCSGRWWFLECNPNGQWAFVDDPTSQAITCALADTLQKGAPA